MDDSKISTYVAKAKSGDKKLALSAFNYLVSNNAIDKSIANDLMRNSNTKEVREYSARLLGRPTVEKENRRVTIIVIFVVLFLSSVIGFLIYSSYSKNSAKNEVVSEIPFTREELNLARARAIANNRNCYGGIIFENGFYFDGKQNGRFLITSDAVNDNKQKSQKIKIKIYFLESKKTIKFSTYISTRDSGGYPRIFWGKWKDENKISHSYEIFQRSTYWEIYLYQDKPNEYGPEVAKTIGKLYLFDVN